MRRVVLPALIGASLYVVWLVGGCTSIDQLSDPEPAFETLVAAYGDPGPSPSPCDDTLPVVDGVAADIEWNNAQPLLVRMSGANGNGGADYYLEIRAIWTDEGRLGGEDRIYFLVRYPDDDQNLRPDQLAYIFTPGVGDACEDPVSPDGRLYCASPTPVLIREEQTATCDTLLRENRHWTKLNAGGREDQVFLMVSRVADAGVRSSLIDLNRAVLDHLGPQLDGTLEVGAAGIENTDLWAWRAGRTNLHPVPQFPEWSSSTFEQPIPTPAYSRFTNNCGFAEDLWVSGGVIRSDAGVSPFVRNFGKTFPDGTGEARINSGGDTLDTVPVWLTECPPPGREPSEEELSSLNGGLAKDLALWRHDASSFRDCDTLACSRSSGKPPKWSVRLLPNEFDFVLGWALRVPYSSTQAGGATSGRDVRARAVYEANPAKGFPIWSLEVMRGLNTGQGDDLVIDPGGPGEYRMVIGVLDASGRVGSGSTEIRLKFQAPTPGSGTVRRC